MIARSATEVKENALEDASKSNPTILTKGHKGAVLGYLNDHLGGDQNRRLVLAWMFDSDSEMSSADLTDGQWVALRNWIASYHDDDGWHAGPLFPAECGLALSVALRTFASGTRANDWGGVDVPTDTMLFVGAGHLGGVITAITDHKGNWLRNEGVELPVEPSRKSVKVRKSPARRSPSTNFKF